MTMRSPDPGPSDLGPSDLGPSDPGPSDLGPSDLGPSDLGKNVRRMNADPATRARISEACRAGMKRWWDGRRLPPMTPQQRWKYRVIREALGREAALKAVLS